VTNAQLPLASRPLRPLFVRRLVCPLLAVLCWGATAAPAQQRTVNAGEVRLALPEDATALLVEYDLVDGLAGKVGNRPRVRVFADGRVLVHQPSYRVDAGDWELHLSAGELDELMRRIVAAGVLDFDAETVSAAKVRQATSRAEAGPRRVFIVADGPVIRLAVDFGTLRDATGRELGAARAAVSWANVQHEAARYPGVAALRGLAEVDRLLAELSERPDRRRVELPPETGTPLATTPHAEGDGHAH
jgi:hypothetical protein